MSAVTPIIPPSEALHALDDASIHLGHAGAVADLVKVLGDADDALGAAFSGLWKHSLHEALHCVQWHIAEASKLIEKVPRK
jgi:hypothetical protein